MGSWPITCPSLTTPPTPLSLPWTSVYLVGMCVTKTLGKKASGSFGTHSRVVPSPYSCFHVSHPKKLPTAWRAASPRRSWFHILPVSCRWAEAAATAERGKSSRVHSGATPLTLAHSRVTPRFPPISPNPGFHGRYVVRPFHHPEV